MHTGVGLRAQPENETTRRLGSGLQSPHRYIEALCMHAAVHVHRIGVIQVVLTSIQVVEVLNRPL
jgi:hypothetical protein